MTRDLAELALASGDPEQIATALISTVFFDDIDFAADVVRRCAGSSDPHLRGTALMCIGHLARIHKNADVVAALIPLLDEGLIDSNRLVRGLSRDAVDDIGVFLPSLVRLIRLGS